MVLDSVAVIKKMDGISNQNSEVGKFGMHTINMKWNIKNEMNCKIQEYLHNES